MLSPTTQFRNLLREPGIIIQPSVPNGLSALIAKEVGFRALSLGGYSMGASTGTTEPLMSLEDVAQIARGITMHTNLPLMVDAGAGWGEPVHVMHTVRTLEQAGASSIHIEDQSYPKRLHYHKGIEHVISLEEMVQKVRAAIAARTNPNFAIAARTDAMRTHGYAEGIRRARAYVDAGAELIVLFPNNEEETIAAPKDLPGVPLVYVNSTGNAFGRGVYSSQTLENWGWKVVFDAISVVNVTAAAVRELLTTLWTTGDTGLDHAKIAVIRKDMERTIGLERLYKIEEETVEQ